MSKYILAWASDVDGLSLSTSVHSTLDSAQEVLKEWWLKDVLRWEGLPEDTTEFEYDTYGGKVWDMGGYYRNADGYGDELEITEVEA